MSDSQYPNQGGPQTLPPEQQPPSGDNPPPYGGFPPPGQNYTPPGYNYRPGPPPPYTPPPYDYRPPYGYPSREEGQLAGFWPRFVATLLDGFIIGIPSSIFYGLFALSWVSDRWIFGNYPGSWGVSMIGWGLYALFCYHVLNGNTLGKSVMGIKLVNPDGSKPTLATFLLHYTVGYVINGLVFCLGFLWVLFDPYKQTWGQKLFKDSTVCGKW